MKKYAAIVAIVTLMSAPVFAANTQGGFSGPTSTQPSAQTTNQGGGFVGANNVTTVEQAKSMKDNAWVTLRGNIIERVSDDLYTFKDSTGTINVDIDHKRWRGITVSPQDVVELQGEVDKDWGSVEIDVKQITKISK